MKNQKRIKMNATVCGLNKGCPVVMFSSRRSNHIIYKCKIPGQVSVRAVAFDPARGIYSISCTVEATFNRNTSRRKRFSDVRIISHLGKKIKPFSIPKWRY